MHRTWLSSFWVIKQIYAFPKHISVNIDQQITNVIHYLQEFMENSHKAKSNKQISFTDPKKNFIKKTAFINIQLFKNSRMKKL